jgi:hypothetical protein
MKKLKLTALLLLFATIIYGQQHKLLGHVTLLRKNAVSVSGGIGNGKINNGNSLSTKGFGLDYFYPIKATNKFSWGLNGGANYFSGSSDPFAGTLPNPYKVTGQITNVVTGTGDSKNSGYFAGLGPQFNFALSDKLIFSPIFQVGYLGVTQSEFKATQTVVMNGFAVENYTKSYDLISQTQTKTSGLGVTPKIRMTYALSDNLGLWVEANYLLGPTVKNSITTFKPEPAANQLGAYTIQQMNVGTYTTEINETKHNAVGFNFGVVLGLGAGKISKIKEDNPIILNPTKPNIEKQKNCITYIAPEIISPRPGENIQLNKDNLQIRFVPSNALFVNYKVLVWRENKGKKELIQEKTYPNNFNGKIEGLKLSKSKTENLSIQMQAIPSVKGQYLKIKGDKAAVQKASCATFENDGFSNPSNFSVSTSCAANYSFIIDSTRCVEGKKVKVYCHVKFLNINSIPTPNPTISNVTFIDDTTLSPYTVSGLSTAFPLSLNPSGTDIPFSFELEGETCDKTLRITYDIDWMCPTGPQDIVNCTDTVLLPCCYCNYCDKPENMNIIEVSHSASATSNNLIIAQQLNITPKNISKITAEIVSIKELEVDDACKECRKNSDGTLAENDVYHFVGSNTAQWSTGTAINASSGNSGNTFPTKIVEWKTNDKGLIDFDLSIALPGTAALSCCERHGVVCVRYSFTDIECKTCSILVCYPY